MKREINQIFLLSIILIVTVVLIINPDNNLVFASYEFSIEKSKMLSSTPLREGDVITLNYTIYSDLVYHNKTYGQYYMGNYLPQTVIDSYLDVQSLHDWFWQELVNAKVNETVVFTKTSQWSADNIHPSNPVYGSSLRLDVFIVSFDNLESEENFFVKTITDIVLFLLNYS